MTGARSTTMRLLGLLSAPGRWLALGALLGFLAIGSNIALMAVSAYLVSKAALVRTSRSSRSW